MSQEAAVDRKKKAIIKQLAVLVPPNSRPARVWNKAAARRKRQEKEKLEGRSGGGDFLDEMVEQGGGPVQDEAAMDKLLLDSFDQNSADDEERDMFAMMRDNQLLRKAMTFTLEASDTLLQIEKMSKAGVYRTRVSLTQKLELLWKETHDIFIGVIYGQNRFFGYMCSVSPFLGIFELKNVSSVAPRAEKSVYLTGSGNKMEFDIELEIMMGRVNNVVGAKMAIVANNTAVTRDDFQVKSTTLKGPDAPGLRFQIVPIGLQLDEQIDVRLSWVSNGTNGFTDAP